MLIRQCRLKKSDIKFVFSDPDNIQILILTELGKII